MPIASPPQEYRLERPGCSGIACGPDVSIRDPSNIELELPQGRTGIVSVRGFPTFSGYEVSPDRNVPLDTSCFSSEGWFDTGDVGYMDNDGYALILDLDLHGLTKASRYLYITGRSKEIINKGGEVISPFEIEEAIMTAAKDRVRVRSFPSRRFGHQLTECSVLWHLPSSIVSYKKRSALLWFVLLVIQE